MARGDWPQIMAVRVRVGESWPRGHAGCGHPSLSDLFNADIESAAAPRVRCFEHEKCGADTGGAGGEAKASAHCFGPLSLA